MHSTLRERVERFAKGVFASGVVRARGRRNRRKERRKEEVFARLISFGMIAEGIPAIAFPVLSMVGRFVYDVDERTVPMASLSLALACGVFGELFMSDYLFMLWLRSVKIEDRNNINIHNTWTTDPLKIAGRAISFIVSVSIIVCIYSMRYFCRVRDSDGGLAWRTCAA